MNRIDTILINTHHQLNDYLSEIISKNPCYKLMAISNSDDDIGVIIRSLQPKLVIYVGNPDAKGIFGDFISLKSRSVFNLFDIICVSSNLSVDAFHKAMFCGVFDYILHPFPKGRLEYTLKRYFNFQNLAKAKDNLKQMDIDEYSARSYDASGTNRLPSGIDSVTFDKVRGAFRDINTIHTALSLAKDRAISKTTARRYLEYAVATGLLLTDVHYGSKGRPERLYKVNPLI